MEVLKDQEKKAESFLENYYKRLSTEYEQIKANRATREAYGEELRAKQAEYAAGKIVVDQLLESQRFWADALSSEYAAIVRYNNAMVGFEFAKGSILQHDNVTIAEGQLPNCALVRAVEHEKQRTAAIVLRERAIPAIGLTCGTPDCPAPRCQGSSQPASLPSLLSASPPLTETPALPPVGSTPRVQAPAQAAPSAKLETALPLPPKPPTLRSLRKRDSDFGTARFAD